jgi:hypothetical protein
MRKSFIIFPAALVMVGSLPALAQVTYTQAKKQKPKGVNPPKDKATYSTATFRPIPPQTIDLALVKPIMTDRNQVVASAEFLQFAIPVLERPEITTETRYQFLFMASGKKVDLSEAGTSPMKPLGQAIQRKLGEAVKFDQASPIKIAVNVYATDNWNDRGFMNSRSTAHVEVGLFEDRKIFNALVFSRYLKENESPKDKAPTPAGMALLGDSIAWDILTTGDFLAVAE